MTLRIKLALSITLLALATISILWLRAFVIDRKHQARYQTAVAMYSHDLTEGASRSEVEQYIRAHGAQPEQDPQPYPASEARSILVWLGKERGTWYCSGEIVYIKLAFDNTDKYRSASLKSELQQCL
jgi:hypothetical protein